jgi:hypothetical protein
MQADLTLRLPRKDEEDEFLRAHGLHRQRSRTFFHDHCVEEIPFPNQPGA